jgi:hypothetical protein
MQNRIDVLELRRITLASRDEQKEVEKFDIEINNSLGVIPLGTTFSQAAKVKSGKDIGYAFSHAIADDYYFVSESEANIIKKLPNEVVLNNKEREAKEYAIRLEKSKKSAAIHKEKHVQSKIKEYKELETFLSNNDTIIADFPAMDVYVTTDNLAVSKIKERHEKYEQLFNERPILPKRFIEAKDMLRLINQQMENKFKKLEEKTFIEDFGFSVAFNLNEEKDEIKIEIKDKFGKVVSSLMTNEVFFEDKEVEFTFNVEGYHRIQGEVSAEVESEIDIEYISLDVGIESDSDSKKVVIFEDGKELTDFKDSKYSEIYELFNNYSIAKFDLNNITYGENETVTSIEFSEADFKHSSMDTDFADIDLTDKSEVMRWVAKTVNDNPYDKKLISKISDEMKSQKATTIGVKQK